MQRALIQYRNPDNYDLVKEALLKAGREDLIGFDEKCLIRPRKPKEMKDSIGKNKRKNDNRTKKEGTKETNKKQKKTLRNVHKKKTR